MAGSTDAQGVRWLLRVTIGLLVVLAIATMAARVYLLLRPAPELEPLPPVTVDPGVGTDPAALLAEAERALQAAEQARLDANAALSEARQATSTLELLLGFLEGAAVLVGLALAATAYFGFRNLDQTNRDLQKQLADLAQHEQTLQELDRTLDAQRGMRADLQAAVTDLVQAHHELSLSNYTEAYHAACRVLRRDPDNPQALYIVGWLELQFVPGKLDDGLAHLKQALARQRDWPAALAALGVGLRRKARQATGDERRDLFNQSDGYLRQALGENHDLIDLNRESFWGPVAGNARDMGRLDDAIDAYREALRVTPASSYPLGNLAALYLQKARQDPAYEQRALDAFRDTLQIARMELASNPRDYFHTMDIAMAASMLGASQPDRFEEAGRMLDAALTMGDVSAGMLAVSLDGWRRLLDHCPVRWPDVQEQLQQAIARIEAAMAARQAEPPPA